jgi:hypothetical protein
MSDQCDIQWDDKGTNVHVRGFYGDDGENEGVLSVSTVLNGSPNYPESGRIVVGSPGRSPLIDGYTPSLGCFSCSPQAAERLIDVLQRAVEDVRAAMKAGR